MLYTDTAINGRCARPAPASVHVSCVYSTGSIAGCDLENKSSRKKTKGEGGLTDRQDEWRFCFKTRCEGQYYSKRSALLLRDRQRSSICS